jgi:hypothetical protein
VGTAIGSSVFGVVTATPGPRQALVELAYVSGSNLVFFWPKQADETPKTGSKIILFLQNHTHLAGI